MVDKKLKTECNELTKDINQGKRFVNKVLEHKEIGELKSHQQTTLSYRDLVKQQNEGRER